MTFSLDTLSIQTLKSEAKALRDERTAPARRSARARPLRKSPNGTASATGTPRAPALPERIAVPVQVGQRVAGTYLSRPFTGLVLGMKLMPDMAHYEVTVAFDQPVNVSKFDLRWCTIGSASRATVDLHGISPARTRRTASRICACGAPDGNLISVKRLSSIGPYR